MSEPTIEVLESGETDQGTVDVEEASYEDLEALLGKGDETSEEPEDTPAAKSPTKPEETEQDAKDEEPEKETKPSSEDDLNERVERMQRQLEGQETLLKRRTSKIAELEQRVNSEIARLEKIVEEKQFEKPREAMEALDKIKENKQLLTNVKTQHDQEAQILEGQKLVAAYIKPGEVTVDAMAQCLVDDGLDPKFVQGFLQNPLKNAHPAELIHLAKRAKAEALVGDLVTELERLQAENQRLKANPEKVMKGVEKALKKTEFLNSSANGSAVEDNSATNLPVEEVEYAELERLLANAR